MRIAILSDIHDNLWNLTAAIEFVSDADALICCGDLCSPFVIDGLNQFGKEIHVVFGNNDADLFRITAKTAKFDNIHLHGELCHREFDGQRFAVNHFDYIARPLAKSGDYDVVCFGHNHILEISQVGPCLLLNPGPIMGAAFTSGYWDPVLPTFLVYDTATRRPEAYFINPNRPVKQVARIENV